MSLAAASTRRIQEVGFRSQLLLLGHPESARVGEATVDAEDGVSVVGRLLMTQCQTVNVSEPLHLVPQIAALSIVPTAAFPKPLSLSAQTMRDRFQGSGIPLFRHPEPARVGIEDGDAAGADSR